MSDDFDDRIQDDVWTQDDAIELCRQIENIAPAFGCHVALTGGTLYKVGSRKDCDVLLYRIRQEPRIDVVGLFKALRSIGITTKDNGEIERWCVKATHVYTQARSRRRYRRKIDFFFPEAQVETKYPEPESK